MSCFAAVAVAAPLYAQQAPDAGRMLREQAPAPALPRPAAPLDLGLPADAMTPSGGAEATVHTIHFSGNTRFTSAALLAVLGDYAGQRYDLAGLRELADRINAHYRAHGLPFARAFLPAQDLGTGELRIEILEGRYGRVTADGAPADAAAAQRFLAPLEPGALIESAPLERATLLLGDLPGIAVTPVMRPGTAVGSGDLAVRVARAKRYGGELGIDNHGNRYTGRIRGRFSVYANSALTFGDRVDADGLYTEEDQWYGAFGYSLPLLGNGLRGSFGYAHTYYELGKEFAPLDATGTAQVGRVGLEYPLLRSQRANLALGLTYVHKVLDDRQGVTRTEADKSSDSLPVQLRFDVRDEFAGGGVTYGVLSWTHGHLDLDHGLRALDRLTARTAGSFDRANLDLARLQWLPYGWQLFARLSGQWAGGNLDSSEGFGLGGPHGVRAQPTGEGFGDEGWLGQLELRYPVGAFTPYAFVDGGRVTLNVDPWTPGVNRRSASGAGIGLRYAEYGLSVDAVIAWRTSGGAPRSDIRDPEPRGWLTIAYRF